MQQPAFPNLCLSHFELYVDDVKSMEKFYAECLGFVVTDSETVRDRAESFARSPSSA